MKTRREQSCIRIINTQDRRKLFLAAIQHLTESVLAYLRKEPVELHVVFVSDPDIRKINRLFHATNRSTDVLAFGKPSHWPDLPGAHSFLGEVIISVDRVFAQARQFGVSPSEELARYIVHGLLHLLGERDTQKRARERMLKRQERCLDSVRPIGQLIR